VAGRRALSLLPLQLEEYIMDLCIHETVVGFKLEHWELYTQTQKLSLLR